MEINTNNIKMNLNKRKAVEKQEKWIEQEVIVPDNMPDALKIINISAIPFVEDTEISNGKIKAVGKIWYHIIYRANSENQVVRGLSVSNPFSIILENENINEKSSINVKPSIKNVIYSLPNERKIGIKTEVLFTMEIKENVCVEMIKNFNNCTDVEYKKCSHVFNNVKEFKKSYIASNEDVMLSNNAQNICELLKINYKIKDTEYKESYNKLMLKGILEFGILYCAESGKICGEKLDVPFSGMVELNELGNNCTYDIKYNVKDLNVRFNKEMDSKTLNIEYKIEANICVFQNEEVEYVEDFYSRDRNLKFENNEIEVSTQSNITKKEISISDTISDIIPENYKIVDYSIDTSNVSPTLVDNNIKVSGVAKLNLLIQNKENNETESRTIELMVDQVFDIDEKWKNSNINITIDNTKLSVIQNGNTIDIKLTIYVTIEVEDGITINSIVNIEDSSLDLNGISSINIYVVKKGDSVWKIAKKYKTSMENIIKINKLENPDLIDIGQKLLIIR